MAGAAGRVKCLCWCPGLWQNAKFTSYPKQVGSMNVQQIFDTWECGPCVAMYSPFSREARHLDINMNYLYLLMLAREKN